MDQKQTDIENRRHCAVDYALRSSGGSGDPEHILRAAKLFEQFLQEGTVPLPPPSQAAS